MDDLREKIKKHLETTRVIQLATSINDKPWVCNVHFYSDEDLNMYWCSLPTRRHSEEIESNPHVAATIKVHEDTPDEKYVIGLSVEGKVEILNDEEIQKIGPSYIKKLDKDENLIDDILSGKRADTFYRLKPINFVLFDTINFPGNPRQEYKVA